MALAALFAIAVPGIGNAAGIGAGGAMMGGGTSGAMPMSGYSSGGMMAGQVGRSGTDSKGDQPGMGNISISGRHIVKLSPARQSLPKIDRSIVGTLVPVPEMPEK